MSVVQPKDLRSFVAEVQARAPESIRHVSRAVSPVRELAAIVKLAETRGNPVIVFHNVQGSKLPVICGVHASRERIALALEADVSRLVEEYSERASDELPPERAEHAPVKDVVLTGRDVDLSTLPIVTHARGDAGPYIGGGVGIARDPLSGALNTGIYRLMLKDRNKLICHVNRFHHLAEIIRRTQERGEPSEVVIAIGHHPAFQIGSQTKIPIHKDSIAHVGALLREPVLLAPAETVQLPVPAHAEIVLECVVRAGETEPDGPYGEFTYYYGADQSAYVLDVVAMTHRRDALYLDIHNVHTEHRTLWIFPVREANLLRKLRDVLPRTLGVHIPDSGAGMHAYVSIEKLREGDGKNAIVTALAADHIIKHVVVVDKDIDPHDERQVLWALATRFQADRDLVVVTGSQCTALDPSSYSLLDRHASTGLTTKMGLDATKWVEVPFAERADTIDPEYASLDVEAYFSGSAPAKWLATSPTLP